MSCSDDEVDPIGDPPIAEAYRELLDFAEAAVDGTSAVLTRRGREEMGRICDVLRGLLHTARSTKR
jgi:hypothetical protein